MHTHAHTHTRVHTYIHSYTYIQTYTFTHTNTHTRIHSFNTHTGEVQRAKLDVLDSDERLALFLNMWHVCVMHGFAAHGCHFSGIVFIHCCSVLQCVAVCCSVLHVACHTIDSYLFCILKINVSFSHQRFRFLLCMQE